MTGTEEFVRVFLIGVALSLIVLPVMATISELQCRALRARFKDGGWGLSLEENEETI